MNKPSKLHTHKSPIGEWTYCNTCHEKRKQHCKAANFTELTRGVCSICGVKLRPDWHEEACQAIQDTLEKTDNA